MLDRVLEPEIMDTAEEAIDYNTMDHSNVNIRFAEDLLHFHNPLPSPILDIGTGTALIPIELLRQATGLKVTAIDAARHMIDLATKNIAEHGLQAHITAELVNARTLPYGDGSFGVVMSNSIVHHISEPEIALAEMARVCQSGGVIFVRDLARPDDLATLRHLVQTYAGDANAHQQQMFTESLHAALTLGEIRAMVVKLGFAPESVTMTSDRHWTWAVVKS
jgi:ubiquinone/menaquinone biosynthesis C-methylase UbiE